MTGTAKVKPPKDDAEWARNTQRRIEQVEHPASSRIGNWVLSTDFDTGDLIASNVNGGSVVIANEPGDVGDADAVASEHSAVKVERRAVQLANTSGYADVEWDTVAHQTSDWKVEAGSTAITIPLDGIWMIQAGIVITGNTAVHYRSVVRVDGVSVMAQSDKPELEIQREPVFYMGSTFSLTAGASISAAVWTNASGNFDFGPSSINPGVVSFLSATRLPIGS